MNCKGWISLDLAGNCMDWPCGPQKTWHLWRWRSKSVSRTWRVDWHIAGDPVVVGTWERVRSWLMMGFLGLGCWGSASKVAWCWLRCSNHSYWQKILVFGKTRLRIFFFWSLVNAPWLNLHTSSDTMCESTSRYYYSRWLRWWNW